MCSPEPQSFLCPQQGSTICIARATGIATNEGPFTGTCTVAQVTFAMNESKGKGADDKLGYIVSDEV